MPPCSNTLSQVREIAWFWQLTYNLNRTHKSLGDLPPEIYRKQLENSDQAGLKYRGVDTFTVALPDFTTLAMTNDASHTMSSFTLG